MRCGNWGSSWRLVKFADLKANGVGGIHFYALNRGYSITKILENLGVGD